jgi:hypothetical protein
LLKIGYMAGDRYVIDTCAVISYFEDIFKGNSSISGDSLNIIDLAFSSSEILLVFPSTVFIEIYAKWFANDERKAAIISEVYLRIKARENMEIRPLDRETLENFCLITDIENDFNFDNRDKQILAVAMTLECPLITSDNRLIRYNERKKVIPKILS